MENWYTREESETDPEFGCVPENRSPDKLLQKGIIIIDKPFGPTSSQVTTWIREELNLDKAGHFGTLDPNATGVLPIGIESGTRMNNLLSSSRKEYVFLAELEDSVDEEEIRENLLSMKGTNRQVPPEKSAVKREEREREMYEAELLETRQKKVLGRIECEAGFYVRVMIQDLAERLDTGGKMEELRRTRQGSIHERETCTVQEAVDAYHFHKNGNSREIKKVLHPIERAIENTPKIVIKDSAVNAVANGADLGCAGVSKLQGGISPGDRVAVTTLKGELVAVGQAEMSSQNIYDGEGTAVSLESVHMDPETYPKRWKQ